MSQSIEEILGERKLPQVSETIYLRGDLVGQITALANEYDRLKKQRRHEPANAPLNDSSDARMQEIKRELAEVSQKYEASAREFTFQALGRTVFKAIREEHPPREQDTELGIPFNGDTYPQALIAACSIDPVMEVAQVLRLFDALTAAEISRLFGAVEGLNAGELVVGNFTKLFAEEGSPEK